MVTFRSDLPEHDSKQTLTHLLEALQSLGNVRQESVSSCASRLGIQGIYIPENWHPAQKQHLL
jgi:hypothetical protein